MNKGAVRLTSRQLRSLINEAIQGKPWGSPEPFATDQADEIALHETYYYDLPVEHVEAKWPDEFTHAIDFVMCYKGLSEKQAYAYVVSNWVFDTMEHEGKTVLLARDEEISAALAYLQKMGGWYFRTRMSNDPKCRQIGGGARSIHDKEKDSDVKTRVIDKRAGTGTMVSRYK